MRRSIILLAVALLVTALLFVKAVKAPSGFGIGDIAADFKLPDIEGKMVSLKDYKDSKGFILIFTCNTCPYAKAYEARIIDLDKKYSLNGFPVIAINPNDITKQPGDTMDEMKKRSREKGYTFPYLKDDNQEVAKAYGATKTPHVFVLNKEDENKLIVEYIGAIDDNANDADDVSENYVEDAVDALINGKSPEIKEKRAIGCTIKWTD